MRDRTVIAIVAVWVIVILGVYFIFLHKPLISEDLRGFIEQSGYENRLRAERGL